MKRFAIISFYSKGRGKSSTKVVKKPASPPKTSADVDLDNRFAAQYDRMLKKMHDRMELLSSSLLYQIKSSFDNPQSNNLYSEDASAFPGTIQCPNGARAPSASCVRGWYGSAAVGLSLSAIIF